jgi:hypothetical protein
MACETSICGPRDDSDNLARSPHAVLVSPVKHGACLTERAEDEKAGKAGLKEKGDITSNPQ